MERRRPPVAEPPAEVVFVLPEIEDEPPADDVFNG